MDRIRRASTSPQDPGAAPLEARRVAAALPPALNKTFVVEVVATTGSTNSDLLARAADLRNGHVLAAEAQTAGRGRRGRQWVAPPGASLAFSLLWRFRRPAAQLMGLSLAVGVAAARALEDAGATGIVLKWPNDLLAVREAGWAKLGGILVEIGPASARETRVVLGIGINVLPITAQGIDQPHADAVSQGAHADRNALLARMLARLAEVLAIFEAAGFASLAADWNSLHAHTGLPVTLLREGAQDLQGIAAGVSADGALILETAEGVHRIVSGEVSLRV
ncbi:MAG: biotin--[acetyl-CoA-carboxylase] ligase [Burkholderiales bacterium]|nr:biotin--[acetyl-CoA-carboxylase] ligase [Burkholderiales bacterium]